MPCNGGRCRWMAGSASAGSMLGLLFLPKCPLCLAMWFSAIGMTTIASIHVRSAVVATLSVTLALILAASLLRFVPRRALSVIVFVLVLICSYH